ncbi:hypothetical protein ncot_03745 [Nocardioides sp. JQ2195]|uniref:hypothetical protein n=1 Tax=Nocardioides sp. JQ2195 TaxID=2592334 RepID=UPI00143E6A1B|nr:hypothetical protein [Nocardioides sp. JQ2195]QIX25806.1 hypothetical protein ncot_03745 [Nocardioides sp. JQ2195]
MNTEKHLTAELHHRADGIDGSPISFEDVVGRAGRIKRRQRITTGVAALAAAAVIVPTAMLGGSLFDDDAAPDPARPGIQQVHDVTLDPSLSEADTPPKLAYTDADKLVEPDGTTTTLEQVYGAPARVGDEYLASYGFEGGEPTIDILDSNFGVTDTLETNSGAVASADHTVAAWIARDNTIMTRFEGHDVDLGKVDGDYPQPVAILGSESCMEAEGGCRVFYNVQGSAPMVIHSHGNVETVPGDFTRIGAVSPDNLIAGLVTPQNAAPTDPLCSAVYDERASQRLFETCGWTFDNSAGFSPDNSLLVGQSVESDGSGPRSLTVVDARTGEKVLGVSLPRQPRTTYIAASTWEDDEHLLVSTSRTTMNSPGLGNLYRVGLDGSVERLLERDHDNGTMTQPWAMIR